MESRQYTKDQKQWLQDRWTRQNINDLVISWNEGRAVKEILSEVKPDPGIPRLPDRLDLRGIDLSHQNLRGPWKMEGEKHVRTGVNLQGVDLTCANLEWVILPRANLCDAILREVNLCNAELILADFTGADLTGADISGAWLLDTKFQEAKITREQLATRRKLGQLDFDYHAYEIV
jgi:uncharacterized protein YjbI with pentapeptide repeats